MSMKVALVYDRVNKWGGAERVLLALHEIFPQAPLYTSVYDPIRAPWAKVFPKVITSFLQKIPGAANAHEYLAPLMPMAFEQFDFSDFDLVVSVSSEAAKGVITKPGTRHICYCLTPTRYLWSGYDLYFKDRLFREVTKSLVSYLRKWDKIAAQRPDVMLAISKTVGDRIKKYYGRESGVIYPPVEKFTVHGSRFTATVLEPEFYLIVSRLVPYKRVDLAIEAFNRLGVPLVIVGTGSEEERLKAKAADNVKFVGKLTDEELSDYYEKCTALVFPQEEDFGLVSVEAQSFGKPVIAYGEGGGTEIVAEGRTGIFFPRQTPVSLLSAIERFKKLKFDSEVIKKNARRFSKSRFKKEFLELIKNI